MTRQERKMSGQPLVSVVDDDDAVREALPELSMSSAGSGRRQMIYETKFVPREPSQPTLLSGPARG
jgi:FixJ family two-component response regulator